MSKIAPLIKQAFGTSNAHEAASFLASACNRMKGMDKPAITREVEAALKGVNFARTGEPAAATKTIYKDTPETSRRVASLVRQVEDLTREVNALKAHRADPKEIEHLNGRIALLIREGAERQNQHLRDLALARASQQNTLDELNAENQSFTLEIADLNERIDRLKAALAAMATGGDAETAQRQELERRLQSLTADLARAQETQTELNGQIHDKTQRLAAVHGELSTVYKRAEDAEAERDALQFRMNQQGTLLADEMREERQKRIAAKDRADDEARAHTNTKARLKFEESNSRTLEKQKSGLETRLRILQGTADQYSQSIKQHTAAADRAAAQIEELTATVSAASERIAKLTEENEQMQSRFFGVLPKAPTIAGLLAGVVTAYASVTSAQSGAIVSPVDIIGMPIACGVLAFLIIQFATKK
ncbi:coiled-coil domain-containing protein [Citrobacter portucalensis]|uniref:hypothetical protein n=1 Tax=Citrobacter portucalensis TaxID=1639133 RepID=UPI00226B6918|nr:hypothetical protein [Citrobacter portucalensis]MCX8985122.1 hypothetical protein [Citrobacter portucalensis]